MSEEYVSLTELARLMGLKRTSLYYYMKELKIQTYHFPLNKNAYVTQSDAEKMKAVKERPWTVTREDTKEDAA